MAVNKKPLPKPPLSMVEIVMRADAATIQAALEARQKVDALLAERAAAYERIAALEHQIDEVIGEPGVFVFPPPAIPVAQFTVPDIVASKPAAASRPVAPEPANDEVEEESATEELSTDFATETSTPAKHSSSAEMPSRKSSKN